MADPFINIAKIALVRTPGKKPTTYSTKEDHFEATIKTNGSSISDSEYVDLDINTEVETLQSNLKELTPKQYRELEIKTNPFSKIGTSIFLNSGAVKLANIDAIFNVTESLKGDLGVLPSHAPRRYLYVTLGDAVGALAQYIQYRKKFTLGYGMSLTSFDTTDKKRTLDLKKVETRGPNVYYQEWGDFDYGGDGTGNLYVNVGPLVKKLREYHVNGVDLVVAKGNINRTTSGRTSFLPDDLRSFKKPSNINDPSDEVRLYRLLVNELWAGIALLKRSSPSSIGEIKGGNLVVKVFSAHTQSTVALFYLVASCFAEFYIIKPVSSPGVLDERYIVALDLKGTLKIKDRLKILKRLTKAVNKVGSKVDKSAYIDIDVPDDFRRYVRGINDYVLGVKWEALKKMDDARKYGLGVSKTEYSISRLFLGWDIPKGRPEALRGDIPKGRPEALRGDIPKGPR